MNIPSSDTFPHAGIKGEDRKKFTKLYCTEYRWDSEFSSTQAYWHYWFLRGTLFLPWECRERETLSTLGKWNSRWLLTLNSSSGQLLISTWFCSFSGVLSCPFVWKVFCLLILLNSLFLDILAMSPGPESVAVHTRWSVGPRGTVLPG